MSTPSLDRDRNNQSPEQRQLAWALRFLVDLTRKATYARAATALGAVAGGLVHDHLPFSMAYQTITAPLMMIGMAFFCGAITTSLERRFHRRSKRRRR